MHQDLQKYSIENFKWFSDYNWLTIFWPKEAHEIMFSEFEKFAPSKKVNILVLWAWSWAFDQRLLDNWYTNITSTDFIIDSYKVKKWTNFFQYDLNKNDWEFYTEKFDYIFAIEVIEHLENQFHFLRNINKSLNNNWVLLISTPNITNQYSKANFIVKWQLAHFSQIDLEETWHIQIIAPHIFKYNYEINWFKLINYTNEWKSKLHLDASKLRPFIWYFIYKFIMLFLWWNKNNTDIYILKKI